MKKTDLDELRGMSVEDLQKQVDESRQALMQSRFSAAAEGGRQGIQVRNIRRGIARMLTVIKEKKAEVQA